MKQTLLTETNLSVRAINCLHAADIITVEDLKKFAKKSPLTDLIRFRNFGKKSYTEVSVFLGNLGVKELV